MNTYQLTFFTLFMVVAYFVATDESVAEYVNLIFMGAWVQIRKYYYMVTMHPFWIMNPIGRWWMMRKYRRMAEQMLKSIKTQETKES